MLRSYLSKYVKCPFGKHSVQNNTTHFIDHQYIQDTPFEDQKNIISSYQKFLLDRSINTSLIVVLQDQEPLSLTRDQLGGLESHIRQQKIEEIRQYLYTTLGDVVLRLDMANKGCNDTQQRSNKPAAHRPAIGMFNMIGSGGESTAERFVQRFVDNIQGYDKVPIVEFEGLHTPKPVFSEKYMQIIERMKYIQTDMPISEEMRENKRKLEAENWHSAAFLMFYMGPLYASNHPRYAPQHNIVINNNADVSNLSTEAREKTMASIMQGSPYYAIQYFPNPYE